MTHEEILMRIRAEDRYFWRCKGIYKRGRQWYNEGKERDRGEFY